ncbi:MAG TPA: alpha-amylase family glycosyl hydrolase, partial [Candidatus Marinimicrobia bacterium]|nr:alpha-amylase family glycosyl hydrolase [Candidatus Neomarinimicrobiota bacterium]
VMDLILNHIGSEHWWMKDLPTIDWINNDGKFVRSNHIHESVHDPHLTESQRDLFTSGWFVETMPDLNQNNTFLENYLIQNSIWWIEYADLSGFRIDTYPYIDKNFLSIWSKRIATEYPRFNFVGEEWSSNPTMVSYWQKGSNRYDGYDSYIPSMMDFPLQEALVNGLLGNEDWNSGIVDIFRVISNDFQYGDPYNLVVFAGNHDMKRIYSQLNEQMDLYKMAMTIIITVRGIPQIYYGTEIAMSSTGDHGALRKDFPGGWPGDKVNAFTGRSLNKKELEAQNFIRKLLNWRKENIAITMGNMIHYPVKNGTYVYFRSYNEALVMVIINNNKKSKRIDPNRFNEVIAEKKQGISILDNKVYDLTTKINLPGKSALILEID